MDTAKETTLASTSLTAWPLSRGVYGGKAGGGGGGEYGGGGEGGGGGEAGDGDGGGEGGEGAGEEGGGGWARTPQSSQSSPYAHPSPTLPLPPSSQAPL
eukprot:scaffold12139_cov111-Isochrysis_galbana.AAC.5